MTPTTRTICASLLIATFIPTIAFADEPSINGELEACLAGKRTSGDVEASYRAAAEAWGARLNRDYANLRHALTPAHQRAMQLKQMLASAGR
jgi:hypothetical protein